MKKQLLLAPVTVVKRNRDYYAMGFEWYDDDRTVPALYYLGDPSIRWHDHHPDILPAQHQAIFDYLSPILRAHSDSVPLADKAEICRSAAGAETAVEHALRRKNPGAAAAIVCAILENGGEPATVRHLLDFGRDGSAARTIKEVLDALKATPAPHSEWAKRIVRSIDSLGLPPEEIAALTSADAKAHRQ
jgi:hypothetical protein